MKPPRGPSISKVPIPLWRFPSPWSSSPLEPSVGGQRACLLSHVPQLWHKGRPLMSKWTYAPFSVRLQRLPHSLCFLSPEPVPALTDGETEAQAAGS